jgi:hypothetical protein
VHLRKLGWHRLGDRLRAGLPGHHDRTGGLAGADCSRHQQRRGVTNAKAVSGIGDKAVEYSTTAAGGNGSVIFVFKSNVVLMIAVTPAPSSFALEQLAKNAVGKL